MIIVEILGGLGNQLFEYAHARALSLKVNQELKFDLTFYDDDYRRKFYRLDKFNALVKVADLSEINKVKRRRIKPRIVRGIMKKLGSDGFYSKSQHLEEYWFENNNLNHLDQKNDFYISGYFGNPEYFIDYEDIIRNEIMLNCSLNSPNNKAINEIRNNNSVSIHIRRGDYVGNSFFTQIPLEYYLNAVKKIESQYPNSVYYIFSDDLNWVKDNFRINCNKILIDINNSTTDYMDLMLMAACKHNIIANSTFSWWGAWLNNNTQKIVIAPKKWFNDKKAQINYENGSLAPSTWLKI